MYEKAGHELALLGEYLNPVAAAFTDVNEAIGRAQRTLLRLGEQRIWRKIRPPMSEQPMSWCCIDRLPWQDFSG